MKRRIGVINGSDSDLKQCIPGLKLLVEKQLEGKVDLTWVNTASQHQNTLSLQGILTAYSTLPEDQKVDVLIIGAGWANHLSGCSDAFLRKTLRDDRTVVIAVAFEDKADQEHTQAAIYSITCVPGSQMIFNRYIGEEGFTRACQDALTMELPKIKLTPAKLWERRTFLEAIDKGNELLEEERRKALAATA